ncbi:undecaprenyl-diphosphate phosphatase [Candidatus Parcubacteria bacterium]|nr:MAG: undecaprenyl-diphosphate phosphatase [Candidatus Parcubacteria bacterium]
MSIIEGFFLSIIQGISEWLPISSSGHLVLVESLLQLEVGLSFDVFLHTASLVVILFFFRKEIIEVFKITFIKKEKDHPRKNWFWYIVISSIFTVAIALLLYPNIDYFRNTSSVANWLLITSALVFSTRLAVGKEQNITWWHAAALGLAQGFAVLPGLSRSGAVIAIALAMKIKKDQVFDYAFLVAIPAILGSFILTARDLNFEWVYLFSFVVTIFVSYLSLSLLKFIMKRDKFYLFFIYTLVLALVIKFLL